MSPIYEYECAEGHRHQRHISVAQTGGDLRTCPECDLPAVRVISLPSSPIVRDGTPRHHKKPRP